MAAHGLHSFRGELRQLNEIISEMNTEVADLRNLIDRNSERIETLDNVRRNEIAILQQGIWRYRQDMQRKDQYMFRNDVTIGGIPESSTISVMDIVLMIAQKLGVILDDRDIVWAERLGPPPIVDENGFVTRPRNIGVRLVRRMQRTELLAAARASPGATTADMGFDEEEPRRFYINERLTKRNRQLFQHARNMAMRAKWRYVWVSNGRIFIRRAEGDPERFLIRDEEDLVDIGLQADADMADEDVAFGLADEEGNDGHNAQDNLGNRLGHQPGQE